ncbi:MAG: ATP-binding cassette domain-containing protein [Candidatus Firestonebacteria bacterium]
MIKVCNLCKYYGQMLAVNNLTFTVEKGRILGFLGPNGSGKTTTMRILSCFMPPSSGTVTIGGMDIKTKSLETKRITGYLPETPPLYLEMKVDEYLAFAAQIKGVDRDLAENRIGWVKEKCGLHEVSNKLISTLSKGYKQRVGIAQSLVNDPEVLILDEPTIGLDPKQISEIRKLIKTLSGERTVILSTHILSEVMLICDDILIINRGKLMLHKPLSEIGRKTNLESLFLKYTYDIEAGENTGDKPNE